jgi:hypothetical protein
MKGNVIIPAFDLDMARRIFIDLHCIEKDILESN